MRVWETTNKEICLTCKGPLGILVNWTKPFSQEAWAQYIEIQSQLVQEMGPMRRVLNFSPLVSPTAMQRSAAMNASAKMGINKIERMAIITESAMVRGAITAMSWLQPGAVTKTAAFRQEQTMRALEWLNNDNAFSLEEAYRLFNELVAYSGHYKDFAIQ